MTMTLATVKEIAKSLGNSWTATEDKDKETGRVWGWSLAGPEEQNLRIGTVWNQEGRLTISGTYPSEVDAQGQRQDYGAQAVRYDETRPSITVAQDREPAAIAREITRRLMPEYTRILTEAKRRREQHRAYVAGCLSIIDRLAKVCPDYTKIVKPHSGGENYLNIAGPDHEFYGDIKPHGDGTVSVTVRGITVESAEALLRSLLPKPKGKPGTKAEVDAFGSLMVEVNPIR